MCIFSEPPGGLITTVYCTHRAVFCKVLRLFEYSHATKSIVSTCTKVLASVCALRRSLNYVYVADDRVVIMYGCGCVITVKMYNGHTVVIHCRPTLVAV